MEPDTFAAPALPSVAGGSVGGKVVGTSTKIEDNV